MPPAPRPSAHSVSDPAIQPPSPRVRAPLTWRKAVAFSAAAVSLVLIGCEGTLRLLGFGGRAPLFVPVLEIGKSTLYRPEVAGLKPFFESRVAGRDSRVGSMVSERFLVPKPEGTLRVAMFGESSVQGFPWPRNLTAASFLQAMLQARSPGRKVEVINCGATAVASYVVRTIADQAIPLMSPDLVVVYTGHNEFYGAFGVAGSQRGGERPLSMGLSLAWRATAVHQSLQAMADRFAPTAGPEAKIGGNLMTYMATGPGTQVAPDDVRRVVAATTLRANVEAIVDRARSAGAKAIVCTIASNDRDFRPVRSAGTLSAEESDTLARALTEAAAARGPAGRGLAGPVVAAHPESAFAAWVEGRAALSAGETSTALALFRRARDRDAMPWRAPTAMGDALRAAAARPGAVACDVDAAFRLASATAATSTTPAGAEGAPGWNLFSDHLHPSLEGQFLLAQTLLATIAKDKLLPLSPAPPDDFRELAGILGDSTLARYRVAAGMTGLFRSPPLDHDPDALAKAQADRARLRAAMGPADIRAADRYDQAVAEGRVPASISQLGGEEAFSAGNFAAAAGSFRRAMEEIGPLSVERAISAERAYAALERTGALTKRPGLREQAAKELVEGEYVRLTMGATADIPLIRSLAGLALFAGDAKRYRIQRDLLPDTSPEAREMDALAPRMLTAGK